MEAFSRLEAIAAPLPLTNVDTDKILIARFMKTISKAGLGDKLFWALRQDPSFVLNQAPWRSAGILVALENFGCGSSREHAPWALLDFGIRCIIAPSFADIFYNNCFKNGILPVVLPPDDVRRLLATISNPATARMVVDLAAQTVVSPEGHTLQFTVDAQRKADLLAGVDEISRALAEEPAIAAFEFERKQTRPWLGDIDLTAASSG
jgi:3-isopropylmalate/(R)-2-methylmalate dehydratase small subunit